VISVGVLVDLAVGLGLVSVSASGSVGGLTRGFSHGLRRLSGLIGGLSGGVLYLLGRASSGLLGLTRGVLRLVSRLSSDVLYSLRSLGLAGLARCLLRRATGFFCGLVDYAACLVRRILGLIRDLP